MGGERGRDEKGKGEGEGVKKYVMENYHPVDFI